MSKIVRDEAPVIETLVAFMGPYMSNGEDGSGFCNARFSMTHK